MDPRIKAILHYALLAALALTAFAFIHKYYSRYQARKKIVAELQSATTEASFYRPFERAEAEATLLRCIALVEDARLLGLPPADLVDQVIDLDDSLLADNSSKRETDGQRLVRRTLISAHESARRLGILEQSSLEELREGSLPLLDGGAPVIIALIDPEVAPGLGKIVPNLELHPPGTEVGNRKPSAVEISAACRLAEDLADIGIIEKTVARQIVDHYRTPEPDKEKAK